MNRVDMRDFARSLLTLDEDCEMFKAEWRKEKKRADDLEKRLTALEDAPTIDTVLSTDGTLLAYPIKLASGEVEVHLSLARAEEMGNQLLRLVAALRASQETP